MTCTAKEVTIGTARSEYGIHTIRPTGAVGKKSPKPFPELGQLMADREIPQRIDAMRRPLMTDQWLE
jgi:hypothetical protein